MLGRVVGQALKLTKRQIGHVKVEATKEQHQYALLYGNFGFGFSSAVKRALSHADSVTYTLSGTIARGSGAPVAITPVTFKAVKNPRTSRIPVIPPKPAPTPGSDY